MPGTGLPAPETASRRNGIRALAVLALAVSFIYLAWRAAATLDLAVWWVSVPLLVLEIHAALGLVLFTFSLWDVDHRPASRDVTATNLRIAVLVPTYNEEPEILIPTVAAAVAMRLPHETWVLDDGARPEIEQLARDLGARYIARPTHEHAKAGNLNHALGQIDADLIAVLDADHVASPELLVRTVGYFDDPRVAVVQTPQEFYNVASFEHDTVAGDGERFHEQALFYRVLQPGKNRWGGAFWCGTGAVLRLAALRDVGGVATETITEDIHTTIRFHRRGWRTVYHNEVLARGLAAADADTYQAQRLRWGTGAMQVLRRENPLVVSGLTLGQRLAYATTLLGWFDAWRTLGFLVLPIVVVLTGAIPIRADAVTFVVGFGASFVLQQLALRALSRGCHRPVLSVVFELVRMTANLRATMTLLTHGRPRFAVTPKGRTGDGRRRVRVPGPLRLLVTASFIASAWFALTLLGVTPIRYADPGPIAASFAWMLVDVVLVVLAVGRIRALRFAPERRSSVRFETHRPAQLDGIPAEVLDVSLTGALVVSPVATAPGAPAHLSLSLAGTDIELDCIVRSARSIADEPFRVGLEFAPAQTATIASLALALFGARLAPTVDQLRVDPSRRRQTRTWRSRAA
ncbi:MAG: glycosyltransferase [Chloroflexota bacterium]